MKLLEIIYAFIPRHIKNKTIVKTFELLRKLQKLFRRNYSTHIAGNEEAFVTHLDEIKRCGGYIENQNSYRDMLFGKTTMQYSGCEIFATYNAIHSLMDRHIMSLAQMIAVFEKDGMVLSGKFGTAPKAVRDFLEKHGFQTEFVTDETLFEDVAKRCKSLILTMYNDRNDIRGEVHTIHISKEKQQYTGHNVYCDGRVVGPCDSIKELLSRINGGKAKGIALIGIDLIGKYM